MPVQGDLARATTGTRMLGGASQTLAAGYLHALIAGQVSIGNPRTSRRARVTGRFCSATHDAAHGIDTAAPVHAGRRRAIIDVILAAHTVEAGTRAVARNPWRRPDTIRRRR